MSHYPEACRVFAEEMAALQECLLRLEPNFDRAVGMILDTPGRVVFIGLGKSGIIGHKISATLASTGTPSFSLNAAEALHGDLGMLARGDLAVMISKSGSTLELLKLLPELKRLSIPVIGLFGDCQTPLARQCDLLLDGHVAREACPLNLAPTSSTTVALVIGDALASALMKARGFRPEHFAERHPGGQLGRKLLLHVSDVMHPLDQVGRVERESTFKQAVLALTDKPLGGIVVCDASGRLEGIITDGDVRRHLARSETLDARAHEVMTRDPVSIRPEMTLSEALDVMEGKTRKIYVVPVVDAAGSCLGLLRMHDIVNA